MNLTWEIDEKDIKKVRDFYSEWSEDPFVSNRVMRNINNPRPIITKEKIWMALVGCLLTTQQRSGPGSAIRQILDTNPFPLNYQKCSHQNDLNKFAQKIISSFRGIRRSITIAQQISNNFKKLENGLWTQMLSFTKEINKSDDPKLEREVAHWLAKNLDGIGPKQSRNLLQWVGVSKYEIPIDSRITKWLNKNLLQYPLTANLLSDHTYYNMLSDGIKLLCDKAKIYPCMLDAAIFTSFDGGWSENDLGTSESLKNA
ncbi:MAG: hypothetical protein P4L35_03200 [Ignavibacteriaceae bacterium]|nr:hypothetical protein [Ignavibacteriaceae bacterium]